MSFIPFYSSLHSFTLLYNAIYRAHPFHYRIRLPYPRWKFPAWFWVPRPCHGSDESCERLRYVIRLFIPSFLSFFLPFFLSSFLPSFLPSFSHLTSPHLTLPYLILPYLTLSYLTLSYPTLPYLVLPCLTLSYLTSSNLPHHLLQYNQHNSP